MLITNTQMEGVLGPMLILWVLLNLIPKFNLYKLGMLQILKLKEEAVISLKQQLIL